MLNNVSTVGSIYNPAALKTEATKPSSGTSFGDILMTTMNKVNEAQLNAEDLGQKVATKQITDIHQVSIAQAEASLMIDMTMQVRNKIVEAYQEVMRMQV